MNMKLHILFVWICLATIGCSKNFLDTKPYTFTTVGNLYKNAENAELGLIGCYNILHDTYFQGEVGALMSNSSTDELFTLNGFSDPNYSPFGLMDVTSQNQTLRSNWANLFAGINRTNYLLENVDAAGVPEPRNTQMKGEGRFLRAMLYTYLAFQYGAVPVYNSAIQDEKAQRQSLQEVYAFIIEDLDFAYKNLPHRATITGRANKWSAAGFLAKVYSYLAACKKNGVGSGLNFPLNSFDWVNDAEMYAKTKTITQDIINNSGYKLTAHYDYLFRETTKGYQDEESLFSVRARTNSNEGNFICWVYWQIPVGDILAGGGFGVFRPSGELFFKYDEADTRRAHNLTLYVNRLSPSQVIDGVNYFNPEPCLNPLRGDYCVAKYRYRDAQAKAIANGIYWSDGNFSIIRFADILLLNAEAEYYTGNEPGARIRLKEVRERSNPGDIEALTTTYHKADFIEELLDERSRELCFEGWRKLDLIRFGKYEQTILSLSDNLGAYNTVVPTLKANVKPSSIWMPIPNSEIELSPLEQNPGY